MTTILASTVTHFVHRISIPTNTCNNYSIHASTIHVCICIQEYFPLIHFAEIGCLHEDETYTVTCMVRLYGTDYFI